MQRNNGQRKLTKYNWEDLQSRIALG